LRRVLKRLTLNLSHKDAKKHEKGKRYFLGFFSIMVNSSWNSMVDTYKIISKAI
jgi:hypothetical protein